MKLKELKIFFIKVVLTKLMIFFVVASMYILLFKYYFLLLHGPQML